MQKHLPAFKCVINLYPQTPSNVTDNDIAQHFITNPAEKQTEKSTHTSGYVTSVMGYLPSTLVLRY